MISAALMADAATMRAVISLRPSADSSAGTEFDFRRGLRGLHHRDARRRDQALQRHHRDDAEHDHHHEGAEIAAPEQHQRARAAAVRHHHAVAEQQPAEKHQRHRERRLQIDRLAEIDETRRRQQLRRGDRDADRQRIGADQAAIAFRPPAAQAARACKSRSTGRPRHRRGRSASPLSTMMLAAPCTVVFPQSVPAKSPGQHKYAANFTLL